MTLQRLTDKQLLACQPSSDPLLNERHSENLKSAEVLESQVVKHSTPIPGETKCAFANLIFTSSLMLKEHRESQYKAIVQFFCDVCGAILHSRSELKLHMHRHTQLRSFACDILGCTYSSKFYSEFHNHKKSEHNFIISTCLPCDKNEFNQFHMGAFKCLHWQCEKVFKDAADLRQHSKEAHTVFKPFECNECGKCFDSKKLTRKHLIWHLNKQLLKCDVKGCTYSGFKDALRVHMRKKHSRHYFTCCCCGKRYKRKSFYMEHLKSHRTDTPGVFKCLRMGCQKTFTKSLQLRNHVELHSSRAKNYACQVCGQLNWSKFNLSMHLQSHLSKMRCPIAGCTDVSNRLRKMYDHMKTEHILNYLKMCRLCGQECYSSLKFSQHNKAHNNTKTEGVVKCLHKDCKETFTVPSDLRTHMKQHGYVLDCDVLDCVFTSKSLSDLQLHKTIVHSQWPQNCQLCSRGFDWTTNLKSHMLRHETGDPGVLKCSKFRCKETFTSSADLKVHMESHIEIAVQEDTESSISNLKTSDDSMRITHECQFCGRIFKNGITRFKKHVLLHKTETPGVFKCIYKRCQLIFISAADCKEHATQHRNICKSSRERYRAIANKSLRCKKITTKQNLDSRRTRPDLWNFQSNGHVALPIQNVPEVSQQSVEDLESFICKVQGCSYSCNAATDLQLHRKTAHRCKYCFRDFKSVQILKIHLSKHMTEHPGVIKCAFRKCATTRFTVMADLRVHIRKKHPTTNIFVCDVCCCKFVSEETLQIHKMLAHQEQQFPCQFPGCPSIFKLRQQLREHERINHNLNDSECMLCGKVMLQNGLFWSHVKKHETGTVGVAKCAFSTCDLTFSSTDDLKEHVKSFHCFPLSAVSKIRPLKSKKNPKYPCQCPGCPFIFNWLRDRREHERQIHNLDMSKCMLCGMVMLQRQHFWSHVITEHKPDTMGVVDSAISQSNQKFSSNVVVMEHVESRNQPSDASVVKRREEMSMRLWTCDVCGQNFGTLDIIQCHISKHFETVPDPTLHLPTLNAVSNDLLPISAKAVVLEEEDIKIEEVVFD